MHYSGVHAASANCQVPRGIVLMQILVGTTCVLWRQSNLVTPPIGGRHLLDPACAEKGQACLSLEKSWPGHLCGEFFLDFLLLLKPISPGVWCILDLVWWPFKIMGHQELIEMLAALILFFSILLPLHPSSFPFPQQIEFGSIVQ